MMVRQDPGGGAGQRLLLDRMRRRFALATLFYATGGEGSSPSSPGGGGGGGWKSSAGWLNGTTHECAWARCGCRDDVTADDGVYASIEDDQIYTEADRRTVDHLRLSENGLEGSLPREIGLLSSLTALDLSHNSSPLPAEAFALTGLENLTLAGNRFSGPLPADIARLTGPRHLRLGDNGLAGSTPPGVAALTDLVTLHLSDNRLGGSMRLRRLPEVTLVPCSTATYGTESIALYRAARSDLGRFPAPCRACGCSDRPPLPRRRR
jgi:hypothetical protein